MKQLFITLLGLMSLAATAQHQHDTIRLNNGEPLVITFIKHSSLAMKYRNIHFQIDPIRDYKGNVTDYSAFPKPDYILVTHEHHDHFDREVLQLLSHTGTTVILNAVAQQQLGRGKTMKNGDRLALDNGIVIEAVPAYNTTPGREQFHPKGRGNGYVLTIGGSRIYIAGDTEDIPEMAAIKNIDVLFLPVNQPYTMKLDQAARAARLITPKVLYPYHFDDTPVQQLIDMLADTPTEVRIRRMQ